MTLTTLFPMTNSGRPSALVRIAAALTFAAVALLFALALFSWIVNAADTGLSVRPLLSADGLRWFFGSFTSNQANSLVVWALLLSVSLGAAGSSGMWSALLSAFRRERLPYRSKVALLTSVGVAAAMLFVYCLMAFLPHAVLLSVTGGLFPSPFSAGLVPAVSFALTAAAIVYGLQSGTLASFYGVFRILTCGPAAAAPLVPLFIAAAALWSSLRFVFGF